MDPVMMATRSAWLLLLLSQLLWGSTGQAQTNEARSPLDLIQGGGTPATIGTNALRVIGAKRCRLVVNPTLPALQPLRIAPSEVPQKNRMGCLSPGDAIYSADGCPSRLCGQTSGVLPLPAAQ